MSILKYLGHWKAFPIQMDCCLHVFSLQAIAQANKGVIAVKDNGENKKRGPYK